MQTKQCIVSVSDALDVVKCCMEKEEEEEEEKELEEEEEGGGGVLRASCQ